MRDNLTMVMSRALYSAMLLLALGPVSSTPEIPTQFFEAQHRAGPEGRFASRRVNYEESFRAWMAEHGVTFGTKGEFERRLRIFAANRYSNLRVVQSMYIDTHTSRGAASAFSDFLMSRGIPSLKLRVSWFP